MICHDLSVFKTVPVPANPMLGALDACARGDLAKAAELEIIGLRHADVVIVPIDGDALQQLLDDAERLDERLAEMVHCGHNCLMGDTRPGAISAA
jgi:hypothetical protein